MQIFHLFVTVFNALVLFYFILLNVTYLVMSFMAFKTLKRYVHQLKSINTEDLLVSSGAPPVTLITPAFNEDVTCINSIQALLNLQYPEYEVFVINDGSTDQTMSKMIEAFDLVTASRIPIGEIPTQAITGIYRSQRHSNLWVFDKENGGKADALNAGINFCQSPLFCSIDADSLLERDALLRVVRPYLEDGTTVAVGGIVRIVNGCQVKNGEVTAVGMPRNRWAGIQVLEYLRAFHAARSSWDSLNATLIISGAFGLFRRETVVEVGGYDTTTVGEDMELVVRLHHHCRYHEIPYSIRFIPDPIAWTECPESLKVLARQRERWQRGLVETMKRHWTMLFNVRYGTVGLLSYPYFFILEMLGPLVEFAGYMVFALMLSLSLVSGTYMVAFILCAFVLGTLISVLAVALEELTFRRYKSASDILQLLGLAMLENFGFRQLSTWWRLKGTINGLLGRNKGWGIMERKGV